jgi:hypothetical protein
MEKLFERVLREGSIGDSARANGRSPGIYNALDECISGMKTFQKLASDGRFTRHNQYKYFESDLESLRDAIFGFLDTIDD